MKVYLFFAALFLAGCAPSKGTGKKASAIADGRIYTNLLMTGRTDSLYALLSPKFQAAVKGKDGFEKIARQFSAELGKETGVETEAAYQEAGFTSYYRISRFEKMPSATARWVWKQGEIQGFTVTATPQPAPSNYLDYKTRTALQLPFTDSWYVAWGGRNVYQNKHAAAVDQRFAYDFVGTKGADLSTPNPTKNEDYYGFGRPVFAPAAGRVIVVIDSVPDNTPGVVNAKSPAGNHIVIDHGNMEYSLLAHFKKGTVVVKEGDVVKQGDLLGQCGNSGQSFLPHLHYHLQTGRKYGEGEGLPVRFQNYRSDGKKVKVGEPVRGEVLTK